MASKRKTKNKNKLKINLFTDKEKADLKLKLIKGFQRYRLVAIDKDGEQHSIIEVGDGGDTYVCYDDLNKIILP